MGSCPTISPGLTLSALGKVVTLTGQNETRRAIAHQKKVKKQAGQQDCTRSLPFFVILENRTPQIEFLNGSPEPYTKSLPSIYLSIHTELHSP